MIDAIKVYPFENTYYSGNNAIDDLDCYFSNQNFFAKEQNLSKFVINAALIAPIEVLLGALSKRLIFGEVRIFHDAEINFLVISKQNSLNVGARFYARGLNERSAAANEYLTHIYMHKGNYLTSFQILRGSVPVQFSSQN